jgi:hypothetical protein
VRVDPLAGGWNQIPDQTCETKLVYDPQCAIRLTLGPLARQQFEKFLPGGCELAHFLRLARAYAGSGPPFEVELKLRKEDVRPAWFGSSRLDRGDVFAFVGAVGPHGASALLDHRVCRAEEFRPSPS